jgi:hypothetical protein
MTLLPLATAHESPEITADKVRSVSPLETLTGVTIVSQPTPANPSELSVRAPMTPATAVPCPFGSVSPVASAACAVTS